MKIIKSDNGFPYSWRAGRVEQLIRDILERKAKSQLAVNSLMLINPTWLLDRDLAKEIRDANPDFIICHNFVDPAIDKVQEIIKLSGIPYIILGNSSQCRIDFWAIVCGLYFQDYKNSELEINLTAKKFICLNRKPHPHRKLLVKLLQDYGIDKFGHISLGGTLQLDTEFTLDQGIGDDLPNNNPILNDICSLGDIDIWKNSCLCIVTETVFSTRDPENFFISEKTWKPIIGLRPFFIYGQPNLRQYLKLQGFDIFDDLIDYTSLPVSATESDYANLIKDTIYKITPGRTQQLHERLSYNQTRFREYVFEQWNILLNLDLSNYV